MYVSDTYLSFCILFINRIEHRQT